MKEHKIYHCTCGNIVKVSWEKGDAFALGYAMGTRCPDDRLFSFTKHELHDIGEEEVVDIKVTGRWK